jgi:alkanesulfonate monooxygenase SsuD/methylene tetrahydromethanopterin reductase-like flavin-dependent oxidoreductase (luciferase family)
VSGVRLGVTLPQFTGDPGRLVDGARRAEDCGLDSVWLFDHLWPLTGGKERPMFECWTSLAYIAAATERVTVGTLVSRSSMRNPAVLAKIAATANEIARGRIIVAIGSGDELSRPENDSVGLPYYAGGERVAQLTSTVEIVRSFLAGDEVSHTGGFEHVRGLVPSPRSGSPPPVWVAGRSRAILTAAGRLADGWNGWGGTPEEFARDARRVIAHAGGRRIELTWAGLVLLAGTRAEAAAKLGRRPASRYIIGGPDEIRARLASFVDAGAGHLIATFPDPWAGGNFEALAALRPGLPRPADV